MVEYIFTLISFSNILELPPVVKYPGLLVLVLFGVRFVRSLLALKPFRAASSAIMFLVASFILSRFGHIIAQMLESQTQQ